MNTVLSALTWPFRSVASFIDNHPSGAQISEHLERQEVKTINRGDGIVAVLQCRGTDLIGPSVVSAQIPVEDRSVYIQGIQDGAGLVMKDVAALTRAHFREQSAALRAVAKAEKAEVKAQEKSAKAFEATHTATA